MELHRVTVTPLKSNCYILKSGTDIAVVDPGGDQRKYYSDWQSLMTK